MAVYDSCSACNGATVNMAGAETFIMNVYRHIDREKIQFDFLVNVFNECDYDNEIIKLEV